MNIRKITTKAAIVLLAVLTLGLAVRAGLNYAMGRKLRNVLEQAKADGLPLTHREIAPACDDADNGAPFWKAAEPLFVRISTEKYSQNDMMELIYGEKPVDEAFRAALVPEIEKNRRVFDFIREASEKACFRYGDWTKPFYLTGQPDAVKLIQAVRLLGVDAVLKAESGQVQEGLTQCRFGMNFVRRLLDEPWLINSLIALADMKTLLVCFNRIARDRDLDSETVSAWIKNLDIPSWRRMFARCAQTERVFSLEHGLGLIRGDKAVLAESDQAGLGGQRFFYWLVRPILKEEIVWTHGRFLESERRIGLPFYKIKEMDRDPKLKAEPAPWYMKRLGLLMVDFESVYLKEAAFEALMLTTKAGLACEIYQHNTGRYPENLDDLIPEILDETPLDPFTGKPLAFKIENEELLIFSFGSNEKDDGGRGKYAINRLVEEKDDDWTWRKKISR